MFHVQMSPVQQMEKLIEAAKKGDLYDAPTDPAWKLLPKFKNREEFKEAIKTIFSRDFPDSPDKDRIVSFYAEDALNSLLFCRSVRHIERYSEFEVDDVYKSWPQFINRVSKQNGENGHYWSKSAWRKVVYHFLRNEIYFK